MWPADENNWASDQGLVVVQFEPPETCRYLEVAMAPGQADWKQAASLHLGKVASFLELIGPPALSFRLIEVAQQMGRIASCFREGASRLR